MASPYRTGQRGAGAEPPRDAGIVGDIVEQFADRFAFYRELVQNAIDADSPQVEVKLEYDAGARRMRVAVTDHGAGMSREVIEDRLLVLFRSTKESDATKIGKFGIGFASVLAMRPALVRVDSVGEGERHVLHLYPDLSYELFSLGRATRGGTTVALELPLDPDEVARFERASADALARWCGHASVPIHFVGAAGARARIDRPLGLVDALVEVRGASADGATVAVVGVLSGAAPYAGFFNHGLMLYETSEPLLGRVAFKIQDSRLGHTLSRDNVRRDASFERALGFARELARRDLGDAAARAVAAAAGGDRDRYRALVGAVRQADVSLSARRWTVPLVEPGRRIDARSFADGGGWAAAGESPLTAALSRRGVPVLDLHGMGRAHAGQLVTDVEAMCGRRPVDVATALTLVSPIAMTGAELVLVDKLRDVLAASDRAPRSIALAALHGARAHELAFGCPAREVRGEPWIADRDDAERDPFALVRRAALVINADAASVMAARERAASDPVLAASVLARLVLLHYDRLDGDCSAAILAWGLDQLVGGAA